MLRASIFAVALAFASSLCEAASPSLSQVSGRYVIVAAGSSLAFSVPAISGAGIRGRFRQFSGTIDIPQNDVSQARVVITIVPGSVATGEARVDAFLKSDAVFDAGHEREIVFRSTSVLRTAEDRAEIAGNLTARGRTRPESFTARLEGFNGRSLQFHVQGRVLRSRYGMDVGTPIYSNIVDFDMDLTARRR